MADTSLGVNGTNTIASAKVDAKSDLCKLSNGKRSRFSSWQGMEVKVQLTKDFSLAEPSKTCPDAQTLGTHRFPTMVLSLVEQAEVLMQTSALIPLKR